MCTVGSSRIWLPGSPRGGLRWLGQGLEFCSDEVNRLFCWGFSVVSCELVVGSVFRVRWGMWVFEFAMEGRNLGVLES